MTQVDEPGWVEHAIWWHVYPLGFVGADTSGNDPGRADRPVEHRLERITRWLDHAQAMGVNGLALGPIFASGGHGYDTTDHFRIDPRLGDDADFDRLVVAARERGITIMLDGVFNHVGADFAGPHGERDDWLRRGRDGTPVRFEGHDGLLTLNHDTPAVGEYVTSVMTHWLERGAGAWRLDAAYAVTPGFWAGVLPRVRERFPDAYVMGEVLHGDYADYVRRSDVTSVTQYELWKAIWSSIGDGNFFELDHALRRHDEMLETFVPYTFVGNHDVTRLASVIADERHRAHAVVLLLTLAGTPAIYYGDEFGMQAIKEDRIGGDDAVRPAFPDAPPPDPQSFGPTAAAVLRLHQELIGLRRRHPWLHRARSETISLANESIVLRLVAGDEQLVVALNLADAALPVDVDGELLAGTLVDGDSHRVAGHGWAVFG